MLGRRTYLIFFYGCFLTMFCVEKPIWGQSGTPIMPLYSFSAIQDIAKDEVSNPIGDVFLGEIRPPFRIHGEYGVYAWSYLDVNQAAFGLSSDNPIQYPIASETKVLALREFFSSNFPKETFWQSELDNVDRIIRLMINDINANNLRVYGIKTKTGIVYVESLSSSNREHYDDLPSQLKLRNRQINEQYTNLYDASDEWAEEHKLPAPTPLGPLEIGPTPFAVSITTRPVGGQVKLIPLLTYKINSKLQIPQSQWQWINIDAPVMQLRGEYHYSVTWSNGKTLDGNIDVEDAQPKTIGLP